MITVVILLVIMALVVYIGLSYAKWRNPIIGIDYEDEEEEWKPKFEVCDWVTDGQGNTYRIIEISRGDYFVEDGEGIRKIVQGTLETKYHLWTAKDAKPGDVLVVGDEDGEGVAICGNDDEYGNKILVFYYDGENGVLINAPIAKECLLHPCDKKQRAFLFQKMHEAGYEWDAEKQELYVNLTLVECHSETHRIQTPVSNHKTDSRVLIGTYDYNEECDCEWEAAGFKMEKGNTPFLDLDSIVFYEGSIYAFVDKYNFLDEQVMRIRTLHHGKSGDREDFFDVTQKAGVDFNEEVKKTLALFAKYITFKPNTSGYSMMAKLLREAWYQLHRASDNGLPILWKPINFPDVIDTYGNDSDKDLAWRSMVGMLYATVIAELKPDCRNEVLSIGYNYGADKFTDPYKYEFKSDPNVGRMVGLCVYSAMRGQFDIGKIRKDVGGCKFDRTVHQVAEDSYANQKTSFFLDLQSFMPSAPGPYLKGYEDRTHAGGEPYPEAAKTADRNLLKDQEIEDFVVKEYNIDSNSYTNCPETVQAIADKEGSVHHLLGDPRQTEHFNWNNVFGYNIPDTGNLADLLEDVFTIGVMSRKPLMEGACYGRRRPGQSEIDGKSKDGNEGVLINYEIEENDGNPTGYNQKGELVYTKDQKNSVYANSYPSGHSSGIFASALYLMELEPQEADIRLREANNFAIGRVICRYHHNSDTIVGRVIGAMISSCIRATSDYDERIKNIEL